jgi:hypothetical protein
MYYYGIKGPDPLIFGRKEIYVLDTTQTKSIPHVEPLKQTQYSARIPTLGLEQLVIIPKGLFV